MLRRNTLNGKDKNMIKENKKVNLSFLKHLKIFIILFFIFLLLGSGYSVYKNIKPANFISGSKIKIYESYIGSDNEALYSYFSELAIKLWTFPVSKQGYLINDALNEVQNEIKSEEILSRLKNSLYALSINTNMAELNEQISIEPIQNEKSLYIKTNSNNMETALLMNEILLDIYIDYKNEKFETYYEQLMYKINQKIEEYKKTTDELTLLRVTKEEDLKKEYAKPAESQDQNFINETRSVILTTDREISDSNGIYNFLKRLKSNLTENKSNFMNKIQIEEVPKLINLPTIATLRRDLVFSFIIAVFAGFVGLFIANYFESSKKSTQRNIDY